MEMPLRCSAGTRAQGAGSPGSQVGGRGITWGGTGRGIDLTLTAGPRPGGAVGVAWPRYALAP